MPWQAARQPRRAKWVVIRGHLIIAKTLIAAVVAPAMVRVRVITRCSSPMSPSSTLARP